MYISALKSLALNAIILAALATTCHAESPPVPVPADAASLNYDAESGSMEFETQTAVKEIADFYRDGMKKLGWSVQPTVIKNDNMVSLDFSKGEDTISLTMMKMGDHTQVQGEGEGLVSKAAKQAAAAGPDVELTAEDSNGIPIPSEHTSSGNEQTLFRKNVDVTVSANVASVVKFFRTELTKKGWKEQVDKTSVNETSAELTFDTDTGPVPLKITRDGENTNATLSIRDTESAKKSPLFPKPGQVKIAMGNITENNAVLIIGGKNIKVPANSGSKKPDGPTLDLPPGKIEVVLKGGAKETIIAGSDQIWMIMIGPGGLLPLQAY